MKPSTMFFALAAAVGVGAAIAAGSRDTAVGIAIGAAVYAAMIGAGGGRSRCRIETDKKA